MSLNERTEQPKLRLLLPLTLSAASESRLRTCGRMVCQQKTVLDGVWTRKDGRKSRQAISVVMEVVGLAPEAGLETWARPQLAACFLSIACQHFV